jgi:hypothetical protein
MSGIELSRVRTELRLLLPEAYQQKSDRVERVSLAKTLGVLSFTPLTMLQACAQAVDFKVGHHFGEGQDRIAKLKMGYSY